MSDFPPIKHFFLGFFLCDLISYRKQIGKLFSLFSHEIISVYHFICVDAFQKYEEDRQNYIKDKFWSLSLDWKSANYTRS